MTDPSAHLLGMLNAMNKAILRQSEVFNVQFQTKCLALK